MTDEQLRLEFSKRLRGIAWRNKGYRQRALSEATGISEVTISYYYNGLRMPKADNLIKIARAIDCTIDDLIMVDDIIEN